MAYGSNEPFADPYIDPATGILRNLVGARTPAELEEREYVLTWARRVELEETPITGAYDFKRLCETHRRLFQDIYDWAGKPRAVEISKGGSQFLVSSYINSAAGQTFDWLADSGLLAPNVDDDHFIAAAADLLEKLNYIHPFREGNGRSGRAFLDQVAAVSGRVLSWRNVAPGDHLRASVNAFRDGHGDAFQSVVRHAMRAPIDGLSRLDPEAYTVSSPAVVTSAAELDDRYKRFPELRNLRLDRSGVDTSRDDHDTGPELG